MCNTWSEVNNSSAMSRFSSLNTSCQKRSTTGLLFSVAIRLPPHPKQIDTFPSNHYTLLPRATKRSIFRERGADSEAYHETDQHTAPYSPMDPSGGVSAH